MFPRCAYHKGIDVCILRYSMCILSWKEVEKSNFRQYGHMEKQRWEEPNRRREEERISERRKSEKKEDARARKSRKVAIHCFSNGLRLRRVEK